MNEQVWRKQASVINNDKFDKRRFQKLYDLSQGLQNLNEFESPFPTYGSLLNDIWGSLYKMKPELKEHDDVPKTFQTNHAFMKRIMDDENFERYRETTRLDDLASAIGTIQFGRKTHEWLKQQREQDASLDEQMQELNAMQRQFERQGQEHGAGNEHQNLQEDLQQRTEELQEVIDQALNQHNNGFDQAMDQAVQETQASKQNLKTLMGGTKAGSGEAELKKIPLRDQLALAEQLTDDARLKQIAEWAGRFKQIARKKQKSKHQQTTSRRGVTRGNDPARLLPAELALYKNETTRTEFLRRFAQQRIRQHDNAGKDAAGQGPVVLCLDQSGSMASLNAQAKGFTLALMSIAKREKRDFAFIPFSGSAYKYLYKKGELTSEDMVELCQHFIGGGTNFESALRKGAEVIQQTMFKRADIVFVTDGEARVSDEFLDFFQQEKQEHGFHVLSLLIGTNRHVKTFSDKVVEISDFNDKRSFTAFEI